MLCVCSNRGFVEVGDSKPKVVIEMSDKQHIILLSIATGIALEKLMVSFLVLIFFLLENAIWSKLYFPCWKNEISVMLWIFFFFCVGGRAVRRGREACPTTGKASVPSR